MLLPLTQQAALKKLIQSDLVAQKSSGMNVNQSESTPNRTGKMFVARLESLRGVAAMMVAVGHALIVIDLQGGQLFLTKLSLLFANGRAAVTIFFVMSGYVLGRSLTRNSIPLAKCLMPFFTRRVFWIYPVLIVTTLGFLPLLSLDWAPHEQPWASKWFVGVFPKPPSLTELLQNLLLISPTVSAVSWSLKVEILGSLMLPLLHQVHRSFSWRGSLVFLSALLLTATFSSSPEAPGSSLYLFWLGYALCHFPEFHIKTSPKAGLLKLFCSGAGACWLGARLIHFSPLVSHLVEGIRATGIVLGILMFPEARLFSFLDHPAIRFLGRISYSFYLVHWLVLIFSAPLLVPLLIDRLPSIDGSLLLALVSIAGALPLSWLCYRYVEMPVNDFGRKLAA